MNRVLRFYIIGIFSLVFLFYLLYLYYYKKAGISYFSLRGDSLYFWVATIAVFIFLCSSRALLSHDLYEYSLRARMISFYGLNPYLHTPMEIKNDMFFPLIFWRRFTECYGPAWSLIGSFHAFFFPRSILLTGFLHKLVLLLFLISGGAVFYALAEGLKSKNSGILTLSFITNPLLIIMTLIDGHNEIVMIFFVLCSLYFLIRSKYLGALVMLALSISVKFIYLLAAPLYITYILRDTGYLSLRQRIYKAAAACALSFLIILLLWLPFGKESFIAYINYFKAVQYFWSDSIPYAVYFILGKIGVSIPEQLVVGISSAVFIILYTWLWYSFARTGENKKEALITTVGLMVLALLATNYSAFQAWYLLWALPLILLSRLKTKSLLVFLLSYFLILSFWKRMSVLAIPMAILYFVLLKTRIYETRLKSFFSLE